MLAISNSYKEVFENILRLTRFGVYFERVMNIKSLFLCRNNYIIVIVIHIC